MTLHHTFSQLLQLHDRDRRDFSNAIHDDLAQNLASAIMEFEAYRHGGSTAAFAAGMSLLRRSHCEARRLMNRIRPPLLDEAGVVEAARHLIHEQNRLGGPRIDFRAAVAFDRLPPLLENAIYSIVEAGLADACEHSGSPRITVTLLQQKSSLRIEVRAWEDVIDGHQVNATRHRLAAVKVRARLLGGRARLLRKAGKGTRLIIEAPLAFQDDLDNIGIQQ
jgi:signal transduction histidine kinase